MSILPFKLSVPLDITRFPTSVFFERVVSEEIVRSSNSDAVSEVAFVSSVAAAAASSSPLFTSVESTAEALLPPLSLSA